MNKLLFMLCIASELITTTTFTMGIDNQPEEKPIADDLKIDFSFYAALDSQVFTWEQLEQMKEAQDRRHQGVIVISAKQRTQNDISAKSEKTEKN